MNIHRAFGVYGICVQGDKLLVIDKMKGPYKNRWDLPDGSLNDDETLPEAITRELKEETGYKSSILQQIGVTDFSLPWDWQSFTRLHHITVFYEI
ncbi:NUDIX domain-containing protein [Alteribacter populi]|uniref:NUDIX domain-containing protein n=1 Tax=Alteribacter populi TaxID=2011011 RepID=UPI001E2DC5D4|nr:NUDIX domain-containing protein [Alteribacter populi]